jgi:hypothetical protein
MKLETIIKIRREMFNDINSFQDVPNTQVASESFVIPQPNKGEGLNDFIGRCMGVIGKENKPQDQLVAICVATYKNKK